MAPDPAELRIVSLIPSATEIVAALGLLDRLVGRSHECDYPEPVAALPACTEPQFDPQGSSGEIHARVESLLESALSVYRVKTEVLETLKPTHVLTQAQCEVCACSLGDVEAAAEALVGVRPEILSLQPAQLTEVFADIARVAALLGADPQPVLDGLQDRIRIVTEKLADLPDGDRPTVAAIEWSDPLMAAGNWVPELVDLAGGRPCFGTVGQHSPWMSWDDLAAADPDAIVLMPCGFDLDRTAQDAAQLAQNPRWADLKAVQTGRVYAVDGNAYFNRPGPRLVDSLEILAEILHPDRCTFGYRDLGWRAIAPVPAPSAIA